MQEVSTRACEALFVTLALKRIPAQHLVEGLPVDLADLKEPDRRIDWDVFCDLLERFEALAGGPEEVELAGTRTFDEPSMRRSRALAGLFLSLRHLYEYGGRWRTAAYFTNVLRRFEELPDGRFRVSFWIPGSQRGCETFFRMRCGAQRATPRWLGYREEAQVEAEVGSHHGVYLVTPPARRSLRQRVRQALRRRRTRAPALWELVVRQEELRASHDKLHAAFEEIEEQARALRESDARFRELAAHLPEVFWIQASDFGRILYASPAYEAIFGRDARELEGDPRAWLEAVHPEDREAAVEALDELVAHPAPRQLELRLVRPDGLLRWVKQRWSPVAENGSVVRFVGLVEDVTERKRLEESVRESQKLEATGKLAGGVAHDFNNLLTVILADSDSLLEELRDDPERRMLVEEIRGAAARGATLADDLLAFGRRQALSQRVIDLNELLGSMARLLRRVLPEGVEITLRNADEPCPVEADPEDLERVILNLATNAGDAMPGGGRLELALENVRLTGPDAAVTGEVEPGPFVRLSVRDDGAGMDPRTRERIFEPFFTTKAVGVGTGLGLAIVHGIVRQARGAIAVDSRPGRGTTVSILLPRRAGVIEALAEPAPIVPARGGAETILLVEDEEPVRRACARVLRGHGYTVLEARDGEQALELAGREDGIQALVTDVVMPGMSGLEVVERVSQLRPEIRALAISGYAGSEEAHQALTTRGVPLVPKPFDQATLLGRLREVLDA